MSGIAYGLVGDSVKQALLEAETSVNTYAPPDLIKHSPGVAKAYCEHAADGTLASNNYNVATAAKDGTGQYTITLTTTMDNANGAAILTGRGANYVAFWKSGGDHLTVFTSRVQGNDDADGDMQCYFVVHGDQ